MSAAGRAARLAGLAVLLAAGLGLPGTGARAETRAGVPALVFRGPRPERVWALSAPPRVVLDFPAGAAGGAPQLTLGAAGRQVRGGAFRDLEGSHPRVVVTLAQSAPYWVRWDGSEGTLYVAAGAERAAPAAAGGAGPAPGPPAGSPAASEAREAANASVASASTASLVPAASLGAPLVAAALTPTLPRVRPAGEAGAPRRAEPPAHRPAAPAAHPAVEAGGPVAAPARSAGALLEDVRRALKRRDAAAAAALLDSCSARLPADSGAAALERLALLEASLKLPPARVEGHARRALQLGAESVHLDLCLGRSLDRLGRGEEAGRWYRRATQITADPEGVDPDRRSAYFLWADALYRRSAAEDALAAYAEALRAYPAAAECPWALYQSAKLEQRLGRSADAVAHVRELTARFPDDYWTAQARARLAGLPAPRLATR